MLINMDEPANYIETNEKAWNKKTPVHIKSFFYNTENFVKGKSSLKDIELHLLGDVSGQCHIILCNKERLG